MRKDQGIILAIDQGTTGTTVLAVDAELNVLGKANREFEQVFPKPGWVEHRGADIWASFEGALADCLAQAGIDSSDVAAIGITNQRETTCVFDKDTSEPLANFIVWQCRRTAAMCDALKTDGYEPQVKKRTGLVLDPYFSGTKLRWLLDNTAGLRDKASAGDALFGTIDTWLVHKLTAGAAHVTDVTNASRTMLMNITSCTWDSHMMAMLDVPAACLPAIKSSAEVYGHTKGVPGLPDGIPVAGMAGDQQAALFGQACFQAGEAKATFGTGCFMLLNTGTEVVHSENGLLTTVAVGIGDEVHYALEGAAFIAGAAVQWLRDGLGLIEKASDISTLAETCESTGDVVFVPALAGLGAPHWRADARGMLAGLTRDTHKGHIARAVLEGIALQNRDILTAMRKDAGRLDVLKVDGGAAANALLMQFQADVLGVPCVRPEVIETTALGAAALAGIGVGLFAGRDAVQAVWKKDATFTPAMPTAQRDAHLAKWQKAIARA